MKRGGTDDPDLVHFVASYRSIQPLDALMVIREARYLSGNDLGKQIELQGYSGTLEELEAFAETVIIRITGVGRQFLLDMSTPVMITGSRKDD